MDRGLELHRRGRRGTPSFEIGNDAYVNGAVDGKFAVAKTLHMPTGTTPTGGATYGTLVNNAPVSVSKPCACEPGDILPIAGIVDAAAASNDNASINLSATLLDKPAAHTRVELPCGHYYFTTIHNGNAVTIVTKGNTAIYIGGDINNSAPLTITPEPGSQLDIFVKVSA